MRFDTPVYFQKITPGAYDPNTGNYAPDQVTETKRFASVTDAGDSTVKIVYGELRQGCKVVRLQNHYGDPFDRIRIGKKQYRADQIRRLRIKECFIVSEVQ